MSDRIWRVKIDQIAFIRVCGRKLKVTTPEGIFARQGTPFPKQHLGVEGFYLLNLGVPPPAGAGDWRRTRRLSIA
jgi:hypothetical protein